MSGCFEEQPCVIEEDDVSVLPESEYDDAEFVEWVKPTLVLITAGVDNLVDSIDGGDITSESTIAHGQYLRDDSAKALEEIGNFEVSPELQPYATEVAAFLNSSYYMGLYCAETNKTLDGLDQFFYNAEQAQIHSQRYSALAKEYEAKNK